MDLLLVGCLGKARGLRGEIYVIAYHPDSPLWRAGVELHLLAPGTSSPGTTGVLEATPQRSLQILGVRVAAKGRLALRLEGVGTRLEAEALNHSPVALSMSALEPPGADEFYYHEVVGWRVCDLSGAEVGTVIRAVETYMDLIEVRPAAGGESFFVPVVGEILKEIDRDNEVLHIDLLEGLIP
jgi:16S rRNA processing protein RimM